jgi:hypothetical protein
MANPDRVFHETWLGMVQPAEGLVVSPPVLERAQCVGRRPKVVQERLFELCSVPKGAEKAGKADAKAAPRVRSLPELLEQLLGLSPDLFDEGAALPASLSLYVPEGQQTLRPTRALRQEGVAAAPANDASGDGEAAPDSTPAGRAGARYALLVWEVPAGLDLDKAETQTGPWAYPAQAKFDRLLRECRVPIGLLSNGSELRLTYAPIDAASGYIPFRVADMLQSDGRPILDAFLMLLEAKRWFGVAAADTLPEILKESRQRQAEVTNELSRQVFEALEILLAGFQAAAERDGGNGADPSPLYRTLETEEDRVYAGLLTVLLRLVFLLYCEDHRLLPSDHELFSQHYSLLGLFDQLQQDNDRLPDSMGQRFGAYARVVALFRLVYLGGKHSGDGDAPAFDLPERRGELFDPNEYPFLEGWGPGGSAPVACAERRQAVHVPTVDDGTVHRVLERLIVLDGQRLSYRSLRVEQIGGVYEALMGYAVRRLEGDAVRLKLGGGASARLWLEAAPLVKRKGEAERARWLGDELGFDNTEAKRIAKAVEGCSTTKQALEQLERLGGKNPERAVKGTLVLQPSLERRRTSSHYTPPELAKSVVERALEPLIATMGPAPKSESILNLVVCDPAMGSGAFLVAACEFLAAQLEAAWSREGQQQLIGNTAENVNLYAKRLIAQRCLLGVDKNRYAVQLARISLWLTTMSRHEPFTFVDHALRHGDSLVGLSLEQIRAFHWKPPAQTDFLEVDLRGMVDEALEKRRGLLALARKAGVRTSEKQRLLFQSRDSLGDLQLVGDVLLGAFFGREKDREREEERRRRRDVVQRWLLSEHGEVKEGLRGELEEWQRELRRTQVPFHWMLEYPEVFCDAAKVIDAHNATDNRRVDAFVGNPPFASKNGIVASGGRQYVPWLLSAFPRAHGNADLCAYFFRRAGELLGTNGTVGFIATNTISQGDTRTTGLEALIGQGFSVISAFTNIRWKGIAAVTVCLVTLARGAVVKVALRQLDGAQVPNIDSRLQGVRERLQTKPLSCMRGLFYMGSKTYGEGFELAPDEAAALLKKEKNRVVILPIIGGIDVNSDPHQRAPGYVISFGQMSVDEASRWPEVLDIVTQRVKPERDKANVMTADGAHRKKYWWQHAQPRPELYTQIRLLSRCLVTARVTKHLCFSFQPTDRIFNQKLYVFPFDTFTNFSVLQSRLHDAWTRLLSSTLETRQNYSASDCFETFPFPSPNPRTLLPTLETIGETLYETRAQYMITTNQGLTKTYNALKDPTCRDPRILELRTLHEDLDRAVLTAYSWSDIVVPPYCPQTPAEEAQLQSFKDEIIDRLFVLNAERAAQEATEAAANPSPARKRKTKATTTTGVAPRTSPPNATARPLAKAAPRPHKPTPPKSEPRPIKRAQPSDPPPSHAPARARKKGGSRR